MKEIKMDDVIWKKGTKLLCLVGNELSGMRKGKVYTTIRDTTRAQEFVDLEGFNGWHINRFIKCENLSRLEAVKAMLDGYTIGYKGLVGTYTYRYDESRNTLVGRDGLNYGINAFCRDDYHIVIPEINTTITFADGKSLTLSKESFEAMRNIL